MSKHTKGPWNYKLTGPNHWIKATDDRSIAYIGGKDSCFTTHPGTPHEANARLIAASPTMYKYISKLANLGDTDAIEIISNLTLDS